MDFDCFYYLIVGFIFLLPATKPSGTFSSLQYVTGEKKSLIRLGERYTKTSISAITVIYVADLKFYLHKSDLS